MRRPLCSPIVLASVALVLVAVSAAGEAHAQPGCGRPGISSRGFVFGSGRFLAGGTYGLQVGWGWGGGCSPCLGWRPPCSDRPMRCWSRPFCGPGFGWGSWPRCGFGGWYGTGFAYGADSVFLATPFGGGATFFSGSIVPFPEPVWAPGGGWCSGPLPLWLGAASGPTATIASIPPRGAAPEPLLQPTAAIATRPLPNPPRTIAVAARRRAARLVAAGDRQLLASGGERAGLMAAAASYRRAAAAAADDPDLHIREALVLTWLGRREAAEAACGRAVAIDGRLAERQAGGIAGVVARGRRLLDDLASGLAVDDARGRAAVAAIQDRWQPGREAQIAALAGTVSADR